MKELTRALRRSHLMQTAQRLRYARRWRLPFILKVNAQGCWYVDKWTYGSRSSWRHGSAQFGRIQIFW